MGRTRRSGRRRAAGRARRLNQRQQGLRVEGSGPRAPVVLEGQRRWLQFTTVSRHGWRAPAAHDETKGLKVLTPGYPGFEIEVEALRKNPYVIANLGVPETVDHLASVIETVETPPIIMGHSFGGTLTQLLLARGLGSAGVVIDSASTEGVRVNPISQARSLFPALRTPRTATRPSASRHRSSTTPSPTR